MVTRTAIESIIDSNLVDKSKYNVLGSIVELSHNDAASSLNEPLQSNDIVIFLDYCTDQASSQLEHEFIEWWSSTYEGLNEIMGNLGYTSIDENDGSGGGLYYTLIHYRKV